MAKYIFVTGGVVSSHRQGDHHRLPRPAAAQPGLQRHDEKLDPYMNVDAGTMNPYQHGEVFVTDDGAETDLDLGHYERFVDINLTRASNVTTGRVYSRGDREGAARRLPGRHGAGDPARHQRDQGARPDRWREDTGADVVIVEVGGTVGDIEGQPFLEAIRQFSKDVGPGNMLYVHVTLMPYVGPWGEVKTKPTQHSVIKLREIGIQPDVLDLPLEAAADARHEGEDRPLLRRGHGSGDRCRGHGYDLRGAAHIRAGGLRAARAGAPRPAGRAAAAGGVGSRWSSWVKHPQHEVTIAIVGKYTENGDAYISVAEAVRHGGIHNDCRVNIRWLEAADIDEASAERRAGGARTGSS